MGWDELYWIESGSGSGDISILHCNAIDSNAWNRPILSYHHCLSHVVFTIRTHVKFGVFSGLLSKCCDFNIIHNHPQSVLNNDAGTSAERLSWP